MIKLDSDTFPEKRKAKNAAARKVEMWKCMVMGVVYSNMIEVGVVEK